MRRWELELKLREHDEGVGIPYMFNILEYTGISGGS